LSVEETISPLLVPVTLEYLRYHWGGAYVVSQNGRRFFARRRDNQRTLTADSAEELLHAIRADYAAEKVPRC
jgi:hypothetical protein